MSRKLGYQSLSVKKINGLKLEASYHFYALLTSGLDNQNNVKWYDLRAIINILIYLYLRFCYLGLRFEWVLVKVF